MDKTHVAEIGFEAYRVASGGKTYDGREMPTWADLDKLEHGARTRGLWEAAGEAQRCACEASARLSAMRIKTSRVVDGANVARLDASTYRVTLLREPAAYTVTNASGRDALTLAEAVKAIVLAKCEPITETT